MARYSILSKALILVWLNTLTLVLTHALSQPWPATPKEIAQKLTRDPAALSLASTDFGHVIRKSPFAVFNPSSPSDISKLIKFSNSLPVPFTIAARGEGHSVYGQAMTGQGGVVLNVTALKDFRNGSGIVVHSHKETPYVDVGGEQVWMDVLHASLEVGLTPLSWTDYLYLSVAGTLSNAGVNGGTFRFGPQISNVHELDVVTGRGDILTCSPKKNSELFHAVLGGLGQYGVITRARIALAPAPKRVKQVQVLYNDFEAFSRDQERLVSINGRDDTNALDSLEGLLLLDQPRKELSFFPEEDHPRIISLVAEYGIIYILEFAKYYDDNSKDQVEQEVEDIIKGLKFIPTFKFQKDLSYVDFLNRLYPLVVDLQKQGLWDVEHPWLNLFVAASSISDFNEGVLRGIILKNNVSVDTRVYPTIRSKWNDQMSAVTPDEDVFYIVHFFPATLFDDDSLKAYLANNKYILQYCADSGIKLKQYLPYITTHEEWVKQYGLKWKTIQDRKLRFDPNKILSPGQGIFNSIEHKMGSKFMSSI